MSIQRWNLNHYPDFQPTAWEAHEDGDWVTYDDHVAEVERLSAAYHAGDEAWKRNVDEAYGNGVQDMRAACIAAVEVARVSACEAMAPLDPDTVAAIEAALREVQP